MQTATSETESKSRDLSICVHHYTLRAPCPTGQGMMPTSPSLRKMCIVHMLPRCGFLPRTQWMATFSRPVVLCCFVSDIRETLTACEA